MGKKIGCGVLAAILLVAIILGVSVSGTYNSLVQLDQATQSQWAQLEGTENRITVERQRFNEAAQTFNTRRNSFPAVLVAGFFGSKFATKPYFQGQPGSEKAPEVKFKLYRSRGVLVFFALLSVAL